MSIKYESLDLIDLDFLLESLLIQYSYSSELKSFQLVSDCVNWDLERGKREFKKIVFSNIEKYSRSFGAGKNKYKDTQSDYRADKFEGSSVFQEIKILSIPPNSYEIEIYFDNYFGGLKFQCESARMETRIGIGKEVGENEWIYLDEDTEAVFNFYDPFST